MNAYEPLRSLAETCKDAKRDFHAHNGPAIEAYRATIREAVHEFVEELRANIGQVAAGNALCDEVAGRAGQYLDWLQWSFWDLPYLAIALDLPHDRLRKGVKSCGMAYLSLRIVDDVVDRHFTYKGRHESLLGSFEKAHRSNQHAEGLTILAGLLVCFTAMRQLAGSPEPLHLEMMARCLESMQRCTIGAIAELSPRESWTEEYYDRLIRLKNVAFWRALYAGIDPAGDSPLFGFWEQYYALAQKLNDVGDFPEDERRAQPNFVSIHFARATQSENGERKISAFPASAEHALARDFLELARIAEDLGATGRMIALLKLGESLEEGFRFGLFGGTLATPEPAFVPQPRLGLEWYSAIDEVLMKLGASAFVEADCVVCGAGQRKHLFEKQGFHYHRCVACTHVYVSPRIRGEHSHRMGLELDLQDYETDLMEVQKFYAVPICHLLRARAPGPRLLDIGFGRGYILQLAKSYGFEVYGSDTSPSQVESLRPQLGNRLHLATPADSELPWSGFDAVVVSHVLEHMERPDQFLGAIFRAMNPDGVLYVAVPDMESVQFQLFGKKWDAVSPLAHFQYFCEATLTRMLKNSLFTDIERVEHPAVREEIATRWMRLLRKLGAHDAGELALVCRRPAL